MPGRQRIILVSTTVAEAELRRVRHDLGRSPVVITAPTADAARVARGLEVEPEVERLLSPISAPAADRGHRLDTLVRSHALRDRFRDVVVVADAETSALLLRAMAPDQTSTGGPVTVVGLPRGDRPISGWRAVISGIVLGVLAGVVEPLASIFALPGLALLIGLALLLVPAWRHIGRELLLAGGIAVVVVLLAVASSARFPGGW